MTISLILGCVWIFVANVIAMIPSRRHHWPEAYVLIAIGIPLLGYITYENGPIIGFVALMAGISILRWPVRYLGRWLVRVLAGRSKAHREAEPDTGEGEPQAR